MATESVAQMDTKLIKKLSDLTFIPQIADVVSAGFFVRDFFQRQNGIFGLCFGEDCVLESFILCFCLDGEIYNVC